MSPMLHSFFLGRYIWPDKLHLLSPKILSIAYNTADRDDSPGGGGWVLMTGAKHTPIFLCHLLNCTLIGEKTFL